MTREFVSTPLPPGLRLFQVDAFASRLFAGNPAAVVPLEAWLDDAMLQAIAAENNLSETAFFVPAAADDEVDYHLRWLTPEVEVDLCGHATLASAHVLFRHLGAGGDRLRFGSRSGLLEVFREGDLLVLDFPARPCERAELAPDAMAALVRALGAEPAEVLRGDRDLMTVFTTEEHVTALEPDFGLLARLDGFAVIATAPGREVDFVSRFFAPRAGVPEDPVTGSAHCTLIPYWSERLGRTELEARQVSRRGGELTCRHLPSTSRVHIAGHATTYLTAQIGTPDVPD